MVFLEPHESFQNDGWNGRGSVSAFVFQVRMLSVTSEGVPVKESGAGLLVASIGLHLGFPFCQGCPE